MPGRTVHGPSIKSFVEDLEDNGADRSIELLIELLGRRQIRGSKDCALATTRLLELVVQEHHAKDITSLLSHVRYVGQRLMAAQPRELVVGNIVRRTLGLLREVSSNDEGEDENGQSDWSSNCDSHDGPAHRPQLSSTISMFSPLKHGATEPSEVLQQGSTHDDISTPPSGPSRPQRPHFAQTNVYSSFAVASTRSATNLFGFFEESNSPRFSPASSSPTVASPKRVMSPALSKANVLHASQVLQRIDEQHALKDIKLDFAEGMKEMLDELELASEQISESALNYINANDVILAQGGSETIHAFLSVAASKKRKFTVFCVEGEPNDAKPTRSMILTGSRSQAEEADDFRTAADYKPLIAMGVNVVLVPDSAVFAIMSSVNKVLLAPHTVLANGGLVANAGACAIAAAASAHKVPVLALSGVYKLSPLYPLDTAELREIGGAGAIAGTSGAWQGVDIVNPMWDYVAPDKVHLYITNLGGHAPSYLYRIVADHYDREDINLGFDAQ